MNESTGFIHVLFFSHFILKSLFCKKVQHNWIFNITQTRFCDCRVLLSEFKENFMENGITLSEARTHWESLKALRTSLSRLLLEVTSGSLWAGEVLWMPSSSPSSRGSSTTFNSFSRISSCQTSSTTAAEKDHPLTNHPLLMWEV